MSFNKLRKFHKLPVYKIGSLWFAIWTLTPAPTPTNQPVKHFLPYKPFSPPSDSLFLKYFKSIPILYIMHLSILIA